MDAFQPAHAMTAHRRQAPAIGIGYRSLAYPNCW